MFDYFQTPNNEKQMKYILSQKKKTQQSKKHHPFFKSKSWKYFIKSFRIILCVVLIDKEKKLWDFRRLMCTVYVWDKWGGRAYVNPMWDEEEVGGLRADPMPQLLTKSDESIKKSIKIGHCCTYAHLRFLKRYFWNTYPREEWMLCN